MTIAIRVPWENPYNKDCAWNELLAWTCETYGLPGHQWTYKPTEDFMDFYFTDANNALMFQLKTAGRQL